MNANAHSEGSTATILLRHKDCIKTGLDFPRKGCLQHKRTKMALCCSVAVGVQISFLCSSPLSSILHNSSSALVNLMGPIKKGKGLFSDEMWYNEENLPGDAKLFTFFNTLIFATTDEKIRCKLDYPLQIHASLAKQTYKPLPRNLQLCHLACHIVKYAHASWIIWIYYENSWDYEKLR